MRFAPSTRLGPYEILSPLGAGGMGEVYRALDTRLGREVALKILGEALVDRPDAAKRFEREARAVAALSHPNIVSIYEFDVEANTPIVVTELLNGCTLRDRRDSRLPWRKAVEIAAAVADGLAAAHARGVIHRDLKPDNIFLTTDGRVKILDFGIAHIKQSTADGPITDTGSTPTAPPRPAVGTIGYASPEQLKGLPPTPATDIFSLGVILYELFSEIQPFRRNSSAETIAAVMHEDPPPLQRDPSRPAALDRIIGHCLDKNPELRFQSARDLAYQLRDVVRQPEASPDPNAGSPRKWAIGAAIAATVVIPALYRSNTTRAIVKPPITSLAILPIVNATKDPALDYLTDGITDSLINQLAQLPNVRITARPTAFMYKAKRVDPARVGKELAVEALTTGRMDLHNDSIVVQADLIDTSTGAEVWGNTYRRARNNLATLSNDIAAEIAGELRLKLTPAQKARLTRAPTSSSLAYDLYLKGLHSLDEKTPQGEAAAIKFFEHAVQVDPDYARAWALLGASYTRYSMHGEERLMRGKAREALGRALAIDPDLAEAHASLGLLTLWSDWDFRAAEDEYRRAAVLNPSLSAAHENYCDLLRWKGSFDEALRECRIARQLDPLSRNARMSVASTLFFAGRYDESLAELRSLAATAPDYSGARYLIGRVYEQQGQTEAACAEFVKSDELSRRDPQLLPALKEGCKTAGLKGYYRVKLDSLLKTDVTHNSYLIGAMYLQLGDKDKAYQFLEKAVLSRKTPVLLLNADPAYARIRREPRFASILKRIGFEANSSHEVVATQ